MAGPYWQDAARTVPADAAGEPVRVWDGAAGRPNAIAGTTDAERPVLAVENGVLVPQFDGSNDVLTIALTQSQPFWFFAAVNHLTVGGTHTLMDTDARALFDLQAGVYRQYAGTGVNSASIVATGAHVFAAFFNGASSKTYRDGGTAIITGDVGTAGTAGKIWLGAYSTFQFSNMRLVAVAVVSGTMTTADVNNMGQYLAGLLGTTWTTVT